MHITAERLFDALKQVANVDGRESPGSVAAFLKETPAVITNWKSRGVSKAGQLKVHAMTGISPTWLATGEGDMLPAGSSTEAPNVTALPAPRRIADTLAELRAAIDSLTPLLRDAGINVLHKWVDDQASDAEAAALLEQLKQVSAGTSPAAEKRVA